MSSFSHDKSEDQPSQRNLYLGYGIAFAAIILTVGFLVYAGINPITYGLD